MEHRDGVPTLINFRDFWWYLLLNWRNLLLPALIAGILLGGFQAIHAYKSVTSYNNQLKEVQNPDTLQETVTETEKSLSIISPVLEDNKTLTQADRAAMYQRIIDLRKKVVREYGVYVQESPYMKLDPTNVVNGQFVVSIQLPENHAEGAAYQLMTAYQSALNEVAYLEDVAKQLHTKPEWILDLMSVKNALTQDNPEVQIATFIVLVYGESEREVKTVLDVVQKKLEDKQDIFSKNLSYHELYIEEAVYSHGRDDDIYNNQLWIVNTLNVAQNDIIYYTDLLAKVSEGEGEQGNLSIGTLLNVQKVTFQTGIKWFIIGSIITIIIVAVLLLLYYLLSAKPVTKEQLLGRAPGLIELGAFRRGIAALYKGNSVVDQALRSYAGMNVCEKEEDVVTMVAASLRTLFGGNKSYLIAGSVQDDKKEQLAKALEIKLQGCTVSWVSDMVQTAKGRIALEKADAVIWAERFGVCSFVQFQEERKVLQELRIVEAGVVLYG